MSIANAYAGRPGPDPSTLIEFLCKTEADWIDLRRLAEVSYALLNICEGIR